MRIAAFDLGDTAGWAHLDEGELTSGVVDLSLGDDEHPGARWKRARSVFATLTQRADWILWERVVVRHRRASNLHVFESHLVELCHERGVHAATVVPSTLKKFATGSGRAKNPEVLAAAQKRWPSTSFATHDEAHARFVVEWFLQVHQAVPA